MAQERPSLRSENGYHTPVRDATPISGREMTRESLEYAVERTGINALERLLSQDTTADLLEEQQSATQGEEGDDEEQRWQQEIRIKYMSEVWYRRPNTTILCCMMMLLCFAEMLVLTPLITLTMKKICIHLQDETNEACDPQAVQEVLSSISSMNMIVSGISNTLLAGKWGELSDMIGRVRVFKFIGIIKVVSHVCHLLAVSKSTPYSKWGIILAASIQSLSGGMFSMIANGNSYLADIMEPKERTASISILMSCIYGTMGVGPMISSFLVKASNGNDRLPVYASITVGTVFIILCYTIMAEPRHHEALKNSELKHAKKMENFQIRRDSEFSNKERFTIVKYTRHYMRSFLELFSPMRKLWLPRTSAGSAFPRYTVLLLLAIDILFLCSTAAVMPALVLFATYMYRWKTVELGYFISITGIGRAIILMVISPLLLHILKRSHTILTGSIDRVDIMFIRISVVMAFLGVCGMAIDSSHSSAMYILGLFQAFSAMCSPTIQGTVIKFCSKRHSGEYFGAMAVLRSCVMLIVPPSLLHIYGKTVSYHPDLFLYVPLVCSGAAILLSCSLTSVENPEMTVIDNSLESGGLSANRSDSSSTEDPSYTTKDFSRTVNLPNK